MWTGRLIERVKEGKQIGTVLNVKRCLEDDGFVQTRMTVKWDKDGLKEKFSSYGGSDLDISDFVENGNKVKLILTSDYSGLFYSEDNIETKFKPEDLPKCKEKFKK